MSLRVAVVGDALLDVSIAPSEPMRPGGDVRAELRVGPGGQGANVAVRLARRGAKARLACALSNDAAGRLLREALEADGVRVDASNVSATGAVAILVGANGERTMLSQRVPLIAGVDLTDLVVDAAWLVISGYALLEAGSREFAARCATLPVRRAILGCATPTDAAGRWRDAVGAARPDLLILNQDEARSLTDQLPDTESCAAALASDLHTLVVVTATDAASAAGRELRFTARAPAIGLPAVDATGAGDAFAAAIVAELGVEWPPTEAALHLAVTRALAFADEVVGAAGAQARVPSERTAAPS